jgi:hypothetical protein
VDFILNLYEVVHFYQKKFKIFNLNSFPFLTLERADDLKKDSEKLMLNNSLSLSLSPSPSLSLTHSLTHSLTLSSLLFSINDLKEFVCSPHLLKDICDSRVFPRISFQNDFIALKSIYNLQFSTHFGHELTRKSI